MMRPALGRSSKELMDAQTRKTDSLYFKCRVFNSANFETHEIEFSLNGDDEKAREFIKRFQRHYQGIVATIKEFSEVVRPKETA